jgi:hypothetical protein
MRVYRFRHDRKCIELWYRERDSNPHGLAATGF